MVSIDVFARDSPFNVLCYHSHYLLVCWGRIRSGGKTAEKSIDSVRKSRDMAQGGLDVFLATEMGAPEMVAPDISGSVPGRTFFISYYILTSTSSTTTTSTVTATATATCSSTTSYSLCV